MSDNINSIVNEKNDYISKNKLQELNDLYMLIKKERQSFIKTDIFLDTILEALSPSYGIVEILGIKIKDIILRGELIESLRVKKDGEYSSETVLLEDFNNIELTFEEQKNLKLALEHRMTEKGENFLKELNNLTDHNACNLQDIVNHVKFNVEAEKNNLLTWQMQLTDQQKLHINSLIDLGRKLEQLLTLKMETASTSEQKADEVTKKIEKFKLRSRLLKQQNRVYIFQELPFTLDGYKKALKDLKQQQDEYIREIDQLRTDIHNYNIITKNEEYQEILKDYKQYKRGWENKLWIYNELLKTKS